MIVQLKSVSKEYKNANFKLNNISFDVNKKEVIGIIGRNGTGKSTILKMINGIVPYDSGEILYKNISINSLDKALLRKMRKNLAYIFQHSNLIDNKTVYYHLSLIYKLNKSPIDKNKINNILEFMNISHLKNSLCGRLSGGEQQKVAIAMALLQEPEILLCDEISSALDANSEKEIFSLLNKLRKTTDISIIMISHSLSLLKNFCDKIIIIDNSTIGDIITPNKKEHDDYDNNYYNYVKEFLLND
ncbi:ABC transporter, ATP-binding protein [Gemella bergeri ATCC 700627]|uniref:ABC transporter, ATP-binding protein n=1 Tax=Gemella bergeri ATCC 700627 TaxID=1321820 RepID=U2QVB0_9BACL|nr:ATP-binding cassette domain-containing protein [Gemella bergeri]ERK60451.1 ABC transporter, ATP-binding protein [Gemella bergeri ATCC 700627]